MSDASSKSGSEKANKEVFRALRSEPAYRIDLKYVGAGFQGWQSQPNATGVQDYLEKALATMLRHPVRVVGAARTDSGVHAEHQVGVFHSPETFAEGRWLRSLHGLLPPTIGITAIKPVEPDFHPIYSSRGKLYRYRLWLGASRHPMLTSYCWAVYNLDVALMMNEIGAVLGRHDFTSFCATDSTAKTKIRTILEIAHHQQGPLLDVWICGRGFLKQMIRILVGTLVDVGIGRLEAGSLARILDAKDRTAAGKTAPPQGLSLVKIFYQDVPPIEQIVSCGSRGFCISPE